MANIKALMLKELTKLSHNRGLTIKGEDQAWIRCPFHKNGQERTPSLRIGLSRNGKFLPGGFICFGCGEKGNWAKLAEKINLRKLEKHLLYQDEASEVLSKTDRDKLFGSDIVEGIPEDHELVPWDPNMEWRTISGKTVQAVGGKLYFNEVTDDTQLFLPCVVEGETVGGIKCLIERPNKDVRVYYNTPGDWVHTSLYPYDYIVKEVKKQRKKGKKIVLFACEGPRDALRLIDHGLLALSFLGSATAWREVKCDMLLSLDPDMVVLAFDPDETGIKATKYSIKYFRDKVDFKRLKFPKDTDPGNLKLKQIQKIKQQLGIKG